jgi:ribonuclease J
VQLAIDIARMRGRQVCFIGRSVNQNTEESVKLEYMRFPQEMVVKDRDLKHVPDSKQFLIVAGAQGQPESALSRIANDRHQFIHLKEGDTVLFSADPIPGNENAINALIEQIYRSGSRVSYTGIVDDLHVSGHGSQGDLMLLLSAVGPRYILPIGGTYKHVMQYRTLARELGYDKKHVLIPSEGEVLEFMENGNVRTAETIDLQNVMIDGLGVGDVGNAVLRDRQTLAEEGIVVVVVPVEEGTGKVISEPDIISRGFVYIQQSGGLLAKAQGVVKKSIATRKGKITDWRFLREQVEENLQLFLKKETGRTPLIVPVILEV